MGPFSFIFVHKKGDQKQMNKQNVTNLINSVRTAVTKHSPEILTGLGIAGMITTTVLAVKATPKALELIKDDSRKNHDGDPYAYTTKEAIKSAWKCYVPAAVTATVSTACLIGASSVHVRRNAALATAYQLSTTALQEYKEKVVETIGEKKEKTIREKIAQDKMDKHPMTTTEVVVTGAGDVLFLEPVSMRCFTNTIEGVRKILNDINYRLTTGMEEYVSLSEFYDEIGLSHTSTSDDIGWNLYKDGQLEASFLPTTNSEGKPCLVLDYMVSPRYNYNHLM